jgi:hypothetical protein
VKLKLAKFGAAWLVLAALFSLSAVQSAAAANNNTAAAEESKSARLMWKTNTITVALSASLTKNQQNIKFDSDVLGAVRRSLATWESVANIKFIEVASEKLAVSPAGPSGDGVNLITVAPVDENALLFTEDANEVSAKTRVFYNRRGIITEADIALNPYVQFSTDGSNGTFDLEATLTHEIGHLLGLEHSNLPGSTMQAQQGRNGIYNLPQTASRTLSESDIANVRALYGPKPGDESCCGALKGKITLPQTASAAAAAGGFQVWLEDVKTGRIHGGAVTKADGTFSLEGLTPGRYRVLAQDFAEKQKGRKNFSGGELGEVTITAGETQSLERQITFKERTFSLKYVGFNGQLSNIPVAVNKGKSFEVYVGGEGLNPNEVTVFSNSGFIRVVPNSVKVQNFGEEISALSVEISLRPDTPPGVYSLRLQKKGGETAYFVGALVNDLVVNPHVVFSFNSLSALE